MAATSVLEPIVRLHRATGEAKYLEFARHIVAGWDADGGPKILSALLAKTPVHRVANAKAYEMLSNLVGLCELYRTTGEPSFLEAVLNAWEDIVANRLYPTGSGSSFEHWQEADRRPLGESANLCETCVTVTWMQLNLQLLRLRGEARFAEQIERTVFNHLLAAQSSDGSAWCYYTPLIGRKPFGSSVNCCLSSGPRGIALLPQCVYSLKSCPSPASSPRKAENENQGDVCAAIVVNLYTASRATLSVGDRGSVSVEQQTNYPVLDTVVLTILPENTPQSFALLLRIPEWSMNTAIELNGEPFPGTVRPGGFAKLERKWSQGDRVTLKLDLNARLIADSQVAPDRLAILSGPLVLAAEERHDRSLGPIDRVVLDARGPGPHPFTCPPPVLETPAYRAGPGLKRDGAAAALRLVPFYLAGADGSRVATWFWAGGITASPFTFADESRSRSPAASPIGTAGLLSARLTTPGPSWIGTRSSWPSRSRSTG
jgi:DUF1680 family protein